MLFTVEFPDNVKPMSETCNQVCPFCLQKVVDGELIRLCQNYSPEQNTCIIAEWIKVRYPSAKSLREPVITDNAPAEPEPAPAAPTPIAEPIAPANVAPVAPTVESAPEPAIEPEVQGVRMNAFQSDLDKETEAIENGDSGPLPDLIKDDPFASTLDNPIYYEIALPSCMTAGKNGIEPFANAKKKPSFEQEKLADDKKDESFFISAMRSVFKAMNNK